MQTPRKSAKACSPRAVCATFVVLCAAVSSLVTFLIYERTATSDAHNGLSFGNWNPLRRLELLDLDAPSDNPLGDSLLAHLLESGSSFAEWLGIVDAETPWCSYANSSSRAAYDVGGAVEWLQTTCASSASTVSALAMPAPLWHRIRLAALLHLVAGSASSGFPFRTTRLTPFADLPILRDADTLRRMLVTLASSHEYSDEFVVFLRAAQLCPMADVLPKTLDAGFAPESEEKRVPQAASPSNETMEALLTNSVVSAVASIGDFSSAARTIWADVFSIASTRSLLSRDRLEFSCTASSVAVHAAILQPAAALCTQRLHALVPPAALPAAIRQYNTDLYSRPTHATFHDLKRTLAGMPALGPVYSRFGDTYRGAASGNGTQLSLGLHRPQLTAGAGSYLVAFNVAITPSGGVHQLVRRPPPAPAVVAHAVAPAGDSHALPRGGGRGKAAAHGRGGGGGDPRRSQVGAAPVGDAPPPPEGYWHMWHTTCDGGQKNTCSDAALAVAPLHEEVVVLTHRNEFNIYHFTAESLAKAAPILDYIASHRHVKVHLQGLEGKLGRKAAFRKQHLDLLGLPWADRVVTGCVRARIVHYADHHSCGFPNGFGIVHLRERYWRALGRGPDGALSPTVPQLLPPPSAVAQRSSDSEIESPEVDEIEEVDRGSVGDRGDGADGRAEGALDGADATVVEEGSDGRESELGKSAPQRQGGGGRKLSAAADGRRRQRRHALKEEQQGHAADAVAVRPSEAASDSAANDLPPLRIVVLRRTKVRRIAEHDAMVRELRARFVDAAPVAVGDATAGAASPPPRRRPAELVELVDDALPPQRDIFALIAGADVLVGAHGAGQTNAIVMRPGSCLVEVIPDSWYVMCYLRLSSLLGLRYGSMMTAGDRTSTIHVNVGRVVEAVAGCVARQSS